jgi:hypothetical protein
MLIGTDIQKEIPDAVQIKGYTFINATTVGVKETSQKRGGSNNAQPSNRYSYDE